MPKATFSVKNFAEFQHYKDRNPIWIKLYNRLLDDYDFGLLPDASKGHLLAIWLLASRHDNIIPLDPKWVSTRINANTPVDLTILRDAGFIIYNQAAINPIADCYQPAIPENKKQVEKKEEKILPDKSGQPSKKSSYPEEFEQFWKAYPTDKNMPKKPAFRQWQRLSPEKRTAAIAAIPGFKRYCEENRKWYRPIYAARFLSEEKFEGYAAEPQLTPEQIAANMDRADQLLHRGKYAVGMTLQQSRGAA